MSRFYIKPEDRKGDKIYVGGKEAYHITTVMRLEKGDRISAFDGTGKEYFGIIEEVKRRNIVISIHTTKERLSCKKCSITLAQSIPRKGKVDFIIQKAAELGVDKVIPMVTQRSVVKLKEERIPEKVKRWEKIAQEAAKQCGRSTITGIEDCVDFSKVIQKSKKYDLVIMPSVGHIQRQKLKGLMMGFSGKSIMLLIGPEGGFDPSEIDMARRSGVAFVSLGENILKSDTAAIAAIVMINYSLEDL